MTKILPLLAAFVFTAECYSQSNLVNNGSFESYSTCPTAFSQVNYVNGWMKSYIWNGNTGGWHTEYVNSCNTGNWVGVPVNGWGSQNAYDGNGYICMGAGAPQYQANYRENIYTQLTTPLVPGNQYHVSYRISLSDVCKYGSNNICAKFGTDTLFAIDGNAHCASTLVTDVNGWTLVSASFVADSAYTYLALGNFFNDANTIFSVVNANNSNNNNIYYIDSVQVYQLPGKNDINDLNRTLSIQLSPNPAHTSFSISGIPSGISGTVEMYTTDGKLVTSWNIGSTGGVNLFMLPANCPKGYYLIRFVGEATSTTEKLLVE